jgi:hypothetical protein
MGTLHCKKTHFDALQVLTAVAMKNMAFWVVTPFSSEKA